MRRPYPIALLAAAVGLLFAKPAVAASGTWDSNDHVSMRLVSAVGGVGDRASLPLGLQFRMKPGWKIYWRSPGDAGYPPRPDWSGSQNVAKVVIGWPAPNRFSIFGLETLGYEDEVILPLNVDLARPGEAATVAAAVDYLTCKDVCIPYRATASLALPAAAAAPSEQAFEIDRFAQRVPGAGARHGLAVEQVALVATGKNARLSMVATALEPFGRPDVFVEGPTGSYFGPPSVDLSGDGRSATLVLAGGGLEKSSPGSEVPLTLTLVDGGRMMEKAILARLDAGSAATVVPSAGAAPAATGPQSLLVILGLALLGGLILNLMPCVLPVLSLKVLSVIGHGGQETLLVRRGFIASAAGILFSFALLAAALAALQGAGIAIGWGIQFQQPVFLVAMAVIVILFASNLFGLFEIALPRAIADAAGTAGDARSLGGHFVMGAFATVLATPCSAPFLGTAVGFALSRGPAEILGIFLVLGLGLALPYLLIAAFPWLATRLPRPGPWMVWLRRILGFALLATGTWLVTVVAAQIGTEGAVAVALLLALIVAVLAVRHLPGSRLGRHAGKLAAMLSIAAVAVAVIDEPGGNAPSSARSAAHWRPFDEAAIRPLTAAGKTVFVDVTADWCLTCQVNKKLVLDNGPVAEWLAGPGVVAMRADWTRPDPKISAYLARFGRYGIPFNAVYGPGRPDGVPLPELLTSDIVLDAAATANPGAGIARR